MVVGRANGVNSMKLTLPLKGPKFPIDGIFAAMSIAPRSVTKDVVANMSGNITNDIAANHLMNALH